MSETSEPLLQLHEDLWVTARPLRFFGVEVGTRMTVVRNGSDVLLHSPVAPDDELQHALANLGRVRWVVGPSLFHHLYVGPWIELGAEGWGSPGLQRKRADLPLAGVLGPDGPWPMLEAYPLTCIPLSAEVVFFHPASRTLVVSDLLFNFSAQAPWLTKALMRVGGGYPGVCCTLLERVMMKREAARTDLARILAWDFDRIVLAHGEVIEEGGRDALRNAYAWLLRDAP